MAYALGDTRAVDGLDLAVHEGEVSGLLGPNGAGRTTAIRCLTTLLRVPAGTVRVFGHDAAKERMAVRRLLGYVPQQLSDSGLAGRENVALFARVFDVPRRERAARVAQALAAVGLADAADRLAKTCSGGMIRRLELAQALVSAPRVTPTPRSALITGKAFAAGVKSLVQTVVVIAVAALLGVALTWNPLRLLGVAVLRLRRPVPRPGDAGPAAGRQQGQPAQLPSRRPARSPARHARASRRRLRRPDGGRRARQHRGLRAARPTGPLILPRT
ncbi:ATP-binding cassette domain-containing protein [Streptomyces echinatus]|uniref:ATP-binding cassette domain-containing protein n=1 Tax=Streptomyces echinatus TaxID=67293 RepID=UPI00380113E2